MRTKLTTRVFCIAAIALMAAPAMAQPGRGGRGQRGPGGPGGFGGFGGGPSTTLNLAGLLRVEEVQKEIDLMDDQQEALQKLAQQGRGDGERPDFGRIREMSEEERREFFADMQKQREERTKETNEALEQILLPPQLDRLREIAIQQAGVQALFTTYVIGELKITDAQQGKLKEKQEEAAEKMREQMQEVFAGFRNRDRDSGDAPDRDAMRTKMEELRKGVEETLLSVLSKEQQTEFTSLKGEEFDMPQRDFGGRGGARGNRGGDRPEGERGGQRRRQRPESDN